MTKRKPRPALNQQIRAARLAAGMTQAELGAAIGEGVGQRFVAKLELGDTGPNVRHLIAICKATGCKFPIDAETKMVAAVESLTRGTKR